MSDLLFGTINQVGMAISLALAGVAIPLGPPTTLSLYSVAQISSAVFTVCGIVTPIIYGANHNARLKDVPAIQ